MAVRTPLDDLTTIEEVRHFGEALRYTTGKLFEGPGGLPEPIARTMRAAESASQGDDLATLRAALNDLQREVACILCGPGRPR